MYVSGRKVRKVNFLRNKWPEMEMSKVQRKKYNRITLFIFWFIRLWKIKYKTTDFCVPRKVNTLSVYWELKSRFILVSILYSIIGSQVNFVFIPSTFIYINCIFLPYYTYLLIATILAILTNDEQRHLVTELKISHRK